MPIRFWKEDYVQCNTAVHTASQNMPSWFYLLRNMPAAVQYFHITETSPAAGRRILIRNHLSTTLVFFLTQTSPRNDTLSCMPARATVSCDAFGWWDDLWTITLYAGDRTPRLLQQSVEPNTHRRRRRISTIELSDVSLSVCNVVDYRAWTSFIFFRCKSPACQIQEYCTKWTRMITSLPPCCKTPVSDNFRPKSIYCRN